MEDSSNVGTTQTLYGVSLTSTGGWAVGPQQTLLHYQGTTWTSVNAPDGTDTYSLRDVRLIDDQNGWAVGDWTTFAGGSSYTYGMALKLSAGIWTIKQSSLAWQLQGLDLVDKDNGWAVGSKGQVAKFLNGQYSPVYEGAVLPQLNAVDVIDMNTGWAVGSGGFIRKLENGTWTAPAKPTSKTLNSIVLVDAQNGWAVGDEGTIVQLANGTWSVITPITNRGLNSIIHASDGTFWVVGDFGTVLRYTNNQWEQCSYGGIANPSLNSVAEQGGTIWAVGNNAHRLRLK